MPIEPTIARYLQDLKLPAKDSHKGQNGKVLLIGGSHLFHAASKWSLDVASEIVDMVFYASVPSNNELIQAAKGEFWNGIVVSRDHLEEYVEEADCILIGPGMDRSLETEALTNKIVAQWPTKKWVVDAGALQMIKPDLITESMILTPHQGELVALKTNAGVTAEIPLSELSEALNGACLLVKSATDRVAKNDLLIEIAGGNPGMTKGGTGDVLAGLVAALYSTQDQVTAAVVGSYTNKRAGDALYETVGPFFNATQLVTEIPKQLWQAIGEVSGNAHRQ